MHDPEERVLTVQRVGATISSVLHHNCVLRCEGTRVEGYFDSGLLLFKLRIPPFPLISSLRVGQHLGVRIRAALLNRCSVALALEAGAVNLFLV